MVILELYQNNYSKDLVVFETLEEGKEFKVEKLYIPENVLGDYDKLGGFCINYKEEIMDNFYIIKLKKGEKC